MDSEFNDHQLLFLVSQPRAGSTLLQVLLGGLDAVATTAEPWLMLHPTYALRETGHQANYDATLAFRALQDFWSALPNGRQDYLTAMRKMGCHLYGRACAKQGKSIFLDKTPRYYHILPELAEIYPEARFIILFRNPLAVLSSILNTWVKGSWSKLAYFHDDLLLAPRLLVDGAEQWVERTCIIRYESLIATPEAELRRVCQWLGLAYQPGLLDYGERLLPSGRYGDPIGVRRHSTPTAGSLDRWLQMGASIPERYFALDYLGSLDSEVVARMGYDSSQLRSKLEAIDCKPGKPPVRWAEAIALDISAGDHVRLLLANGRWNRLTRKLRQLTGSLRDRF